MELCKNKHSPKLIYYTLVKIFLALSRLWYLIHMLKNFPKQYVGSNYHESLLVEVNLGKLVLPAFLLISWGFNFKSQSYNYYFINLENDNWEILYRNYLLLKALRIETGKIICNANCLAVQTFTKTCFQIWYIVNNTN